MATAYSFRTLAQEHIRLLTIAGLDLPLQYNLVYVPIEDAGEYDALSYVWGSSDRTEFIICDGQRLDVTSNLHDALCYISRIECRGQFGLMEFASISRTTRRRQDK
jgi:hypothetical protein